MTDGPWFRGEFHLTNRWLRCAVCGQPLQPGPTIRRGDEYAHVGCGARTERREPKRTKRKR
jgi:hypothetical protein